MTSYQKRIQDAMDETAKMLTHFEAKKTFDDEQEAEKQERIAFYSQHMIKLADMMGA